MHLAAPATTDYWVNDQRGDPLFVVTADANAKALNGHKRGFGRVVGKQEVIPFLPLWPLSIHDGGLGLAESRWQFRPQHF
jgi:hypothetical protein